MHTSSQEKTKKKTNSNLTTSIKGFPCYKHKTDVLQDNNNKLKLQFNKEFSSEKPFGIFFMEVTVHVFCASPCSLNPCSSLFCLYNLFCNHMEWQFFFTQYTLSRYFSLCSHSSSGQIKLSWTNVSFSENISSWK